jgi:hypothetical protein
VASPHAGTRLGLVVGGGHTELTLQGRDPCPEAEEVGELAQRRHPRTVRGIDRGGQAAEVTGVMRAHALVLVDTPVNAGEELAPSPLLLTIDFGGALAR